MKILLATNNRHKLSEFQAILKDDGVKVLGLSDMPEKLEVEETGKTFLENALLKAKAAFSKFKIPTVADDSGIEIYALDNQPGVISSRFAGEQATDEENNKKVLSLLKDIPAENRKARFVCTAVFLPDESSDMSFAEGYVEGEILEAPRGLQGFGYDPLFYYPPFQKTFAELSMEEKNSISHRKKAITAIHDKIRKYKNALENPNTQ